MICGGGFVGRGETVRVGFEVLRKEGTEGKNEEEPGMGGPRETQTPRTQVSDMPQHLLTQNDISELFARGG